MKRIALAELVPALVLSPLVLLLGAAAVLAGA
jgi:hypothetical protein